jgi:hypothetical protein
MILISLLYMNVFAEVEQEVNKNLLFSLTKYEKERLMIHQYFRISEKEKRYTDVYVSKYDLNNDGQEEVFSYITGVRHCGNQTGCYIRIYKLDEHKLVEIYQGGIPTFFNVNIEEDGVQNYIKVSDEIRNGWNNILLKSKILLQYNLNSKNYKVVKK